MVYDHYDRGKGALCTYASVLNFDVATRTILGEVTKSLYNVFGWEKRRGEGSIEQDEGFTFSLIWMFFKREGERIWGCLKVTWDRFSPQIFWLVMALGKSSNNLART